MIPNSLIIQYDQSNITYENHKAEVSIEKEVPLHLPAMTKIQALHRCKASGLGLYLLERKSKRINPSKKSLAYPPLGIVSTGVVGAEIGSRLG